MYLAPSTIMDDAAPQSLPECNTTAALKQGKNFCFNLDPYPEGFDPKQKFKIYSDSEPDEEEFDGPLVNVLATSELLASTTLGNGAASETNYIDEEDVNRTSNIAKNEFKKMKMVVGGTVNKWICVNFACNVANDDVSKFCEKLAETCSAFGMTFDAEPVMPISKALPDSVDFCLRIIFDDAKHHLQGKELDMVIFILPDNNSSLYDDLKRICETDPGVAFQCFLAKHVYEMSNHDFTNVSLEINEKVGGRNTVIYGREKPITINI